jgi:hypothetical protein
MEIPIVLYTHSEYSFLWRATIPLLERYAAGFKIYWVTNDMADFSVPASLTVRYYSESLPWSFRILPTLKEIAGDYVMYLQEDWLLINHLPKERLANFVEFMQEVSCEFLMSYPFPWIDTPYFIELGDVHAYSMPCHYMQPAIWKKSLLEELCCEPRTIKEYENQECYEITSGRNCLGVINRDYKVKKCHTTSSPLFPYMHAIIKGEWTFLRYPALKALVEAYGVETKGRGINTDWFVEFQ